MEQILIDDSYIDAELINHFGQKYPKILIQNNEILRPALAPEHLCRDVFVEPNDQNIYKRFVRHYRMKGFISMLNYIRQTYHEINDNDQQRKQSDLNHSRHGLLCAYILAVIILQIYSIYYAIYSHFYPFDKYSDDELLNEFMENPEWKSGLIRAFVWHPNSLRCALALVNDFIYIYSADGRKPINHVKCLKDVQQKRISSLCWHPKLDNVLIVACRNKILIWRIEHISNIHSPEFSEQPKSSLQIVDTHLQSPITSLAFNPKGNILVGCSPRNASLSIIRFDDKFQMIKMETIRMKQASSLIHLPQSTSLHWSPDGQRLLTLTTLASKPICIFESITWSYKFWTFPHEYPQQLCQTAVWSRPNGMILLFAPKRSSKIFALIFYDRAEAGDVGGGSSDNCQLLLDTKQFLPEKLNNSSPSIQRLCWDVKSTKLAVSFQDPSEIIVIFSTSLNPGLNIQPYRIVRPSFTPHSNIKCLLMNFHDNYSDPGCLITFCWSNGILTHLPLENDSTKNNDKSLNESIRSLTSLCTSYDETSFVKPYNSLISTPIQNGTMKNVINQSYDRIKHLSTTPYRRSVLYSTLIHDD